MRVIFLALAAAMIAAPAMAESAKGEDSSTPQWLTEPTLGDLAAVWPKTAMARGEGGRAVLRCEVTTQGTLEGCVVASEAPAGMGFGAAALALTPNFVMKPAMRDGKPIRASVGIPIVWNPRGMDVGTRLVNSDTVILNPTWARAPTFADLQAAWPAKATGDFGHVSMRCALTRQATLQACDVLDETPKGQGFGKAATTLIAPKFQLRINTAEADNFVHDKVTSAVHFMNPSSKTPRQVVHPKWVTTIDPAQVQAVYPQKAADAGITSGRGVADCAVATDGHLVDCKPAYATPEGMGFAEAAVQIAQVMQMNLWTEGGSPVDGVRLRLPISFNLAPDENAPAPAKP